MPQTETSARALRRVGWLVGLVPLAGLWAGVAFWAAPGIATRVTGEGEGIAAATAAGNGEPWLRITARGRDLVALGEAPDEASRAIALARLNALESPRRIVPEIGLVETAAPFQWAATWTGHTGVTLEGSRPVEIGRRALEVEVTGAIGAGTPLRDAARAAKGAPPDFAAAAAFLAARLPSLAPGGKAVLTDTVLSLSGEALDLAAYDALRSALARPPEGFSLGRIDVLPPRITEYRFALARTGAGVTLSGFVPSEAVRQAALALARLTTEGGRVEDRLQAARGLPSGVDPLVLIDFMGKFAALIQAGEVAYEGGAVSVRGDAIDPQAIPDAQALMREARPAGIGAGTVSLVAKPLSPYRVSLRRTAEAVTVSGHLPDEETRRRVLAALRQKIFREPVIDRTRIAEGAPAGLAPALEAGVGLLSTLATGEATVIDRTLNLSGESLYPEAAARAPEKVAAVLPPGWTGEVAVDAKEPEARRDGDSCRQGVAAATATADLRFPVGSTALTPAFYPALDALAALAKTCPDLKVAVSGPADPPGAKPPPSDDPKPPEKKTAAKAKAEKGKAEKEKPAEPVAEAKPPEDETSGLARQRALALVEYLLQAGMRPGQIAAGPDKGAGPATVALAP
ncbi:BON domain-containing protein [Methylobacterium komagatae]|uniref:BON domain-containing protein n=1 Tax=Methylobacterium komagatae TaxID=374425 RepID=A0ABW2BIU6_9HYPH